MTDNRTAGQRIRREGKPKIQPMDQRKSLVDYIPTRVIAGLFLTLLLYSTCLYIFGDGSGW